MILLFSGQKTSEEVECYHPEKKTWFAINDMNLGRSAVSACAIRDLYNSQDFTFHGNVQVDPSEMKLKTPTKTRENVEFANILAQWRGPDCAQSFSSLYEQLSDQDSSFENSLIDV